MSPVPTEYLRGNNEPMRCIDKCLWYGECIAKRGMYCGITVEIFKKMRGSS